MVSNLNPWYADDIAKILKQLSRSSSVFKCKTISRLAKRPEVYTKVQTALPGALHSCLNYSIVLGVSIAPAVDVLVVVVIV